MQRVETRHLWFIVPLSSLLTLSLLPPPRIISSLPPMSAFSQAFLAGELDTGFVKRVYPTGFSDDRLTEREMVSYRMGTALHCTAQCLC